MSARDTATSGLRRALATARQWLADSPWTPVALKLSVGLAMFLGLALVGSGVALGVLPGSAEPRAAAAPIAASAPAPSQLDGGDGARADAGAPPPSVDGGADGGAVTADGKVILNLATEDDLRRLPGIGTTRARAIVELRGRLGKLKRPEDLMRVKGIGRRMMGRLRPLVVVDPPS